MSIEKIIDGLETREGVILIITQMIKDNPNDQNLGKVIRENFKDYLEVDE